MAGTQQEVLAGGEAARGGAALRAGKYAIALSVAAGIAASMLALAPAAQAAAAAPNATARIQALLNKPVDGIVDLPSGTFSVQPTLKLQQGERIIGHGTTLRVATGSGNYYAMLTGTDATTDLSGLAITGVTFDQNSSGNPIRTSAPLFNGKPRFVLLIAAGTGIKITNDRFIGSDNVDTIVTGGATQNVTISHNEFATINTPLHDHSTIYTSGTDTVISDNTFTGRALVDSAAIEVHGDHASITGNHVSGYYKAANIVASDTTFQGNHVSGAANPVDLWSVTSAGLRNVTVTGNVLNRNLAHWARVLRSLGGSLPTARSTGQVTRDAHSTQSFHDITIGHNKG